MASLLDRFRRCLKKILYILPHHDDDIFVVPKINYDLKNSHNLKFFFLMTSESRLNESITFLKRLGVKEKDIVSIGKKFLIPVNHVHQNLEHVFIQI